MGVHEGCYNGISLMLSEPLQALAVRPGWSVRTSSNFLTKLSGSVLSQIGTNCISSHERPASIGRLSEQQGDVRSNLVQQPPLTS